MPKPEVVSRDCRHASVEGPAGYQCCKFREPSLYFGRDIREKKLSDTKIDPLMARYRVDVELGSYGCKVVCEGRFKRNSVLGSNPKIRDLCAIVIVHFVTLSELVATRYYSTPSSHSV